MKSAMKILAAGALLIMMGAAAASAQGAGARSMTPAIMVKKDIPYVLGGTPLQTGDLFAPRTSTLHAAILLIHGGAWKWGTRNDPGVTYMAPRLAAAGFTVFNISYRLVEQGGRFPDDLEDCKTALAWMVIHAKKLRINPKDIFIVGTSAGAHLALMAAYTARTHLFPATDFPHVALNVKAVVGFYTPTNLMLVNGVPHNSWAYKVVINYLKAWLVKHPKNGLLSASPIAYIKTAVPTLLLQGTQDKLVPPVLAETMKNVLLAAHQPVKLIMVHGVGHAFMNFPGRVRKIALRETIQYLRLQLQK